MDNPFVFGAAFRRRLRRRVWLLLIQRIANIKRTALIISTNPLYIPILSTILINSIKQSNLLHAMVATFCINTDYNVYTNPLVVIYLYCHHHTNKHGTVAQEKPEGRI